MFRVPNQRRCMLKPTPRRPYAGPLLGTHSVSGVPLGVLTLRTHFTTSTGSGTTSNPHCLERAETLREAKCVAATSQGTSNFISENGCPFIARLQPSGLEGSHNSAPSRHCSGMLLMPLACSFRTGLLRILVSNYHDKPPVQYFQNVPV